ncbi:MAG TPA: DNA polymerase III subunit alpha [Acidimicrobiales bacterium]|nr:DNA polymerase III subunit alpha [Acidimicrobiales bacterium]
MGSSFTHLHLHTEYSMLDGAARVADVVRAAVADGQPAIGMTDHGNMYGTIDFYETCRKNGVNPVIGFEAYMAGESRFDRPPRRGRVDDTGGDAGDGSQKLYYHLTLLAENNAGYQNLMKLSSYAFLEGYYYQPRLDWELLDRYSEGVIATSGCLGGVVLQSLLHGDQRTATKLAGRLQDIFGRDNFFIELQDHGLDEQRLTNPMLLEVAKEIQAPLLATNDSHYTDHADATSHDALLCVQTNSTVDDPNRFRFGSDQHYFKTAAEMRYLFRELPEACDNSLWIAERANVTIDFDRAELPKFPLPEGFSDDAEYLRHTTYQGARERYGDALPKEVTDRLDYELQVIGSMGFSTYFLIVADLIRHARERRIRVGPGRGSAAGCCVAYCLRITNLDPIRFDLLFERFLNPGRRQMPDIDMDFDERYRGEMIRYVADTYGRDRLAQIVTFSTIKARAAVRDAARVLGYPYIVGDKIAKAMPPLIMGRDTPLGACLNLDPMHEGGFKMAGDLRTMYETDPDARKVIDVAMGLEGLRRQSGIHASAVVISREPLIEYCPVQRKPESGVELEDAPIVTQYEGPAIEKLGLLKMDFLGLRNLTVIEQALDLIEVNTGERPDVDTLSLEDPKTLALLRTGETIGVFQLEGGPMRSLVRALAPTSFDDVSALLALYRPGPMAANMHYDYADRKNGRKPIEYIHPEMEELLGDTYGLMIYQESMMRVAQRFAGYSLAEADNLRKAAGKKVRAIMAAERQKFVDGCEQTGYGPELGTKLFDIIEPFADYAFNKSHTYAYGLVSWQTAWLKAHHPVEYFAALLTSVRDDKDATAKYLSECRTLGIEVQVPNVNESVAGFGAKGRTIPFGLAAVRNVGRHLVEMIVREREANGPFVDFYDFCQRVDPVVLNKRSIDSLVKSGAFDALGHPRQGLCLAAESIVDMILQRRRERDVGVMSLFDTLDESGEPNWDDTRLPIADVEFDKMTRLAFEKEMLGLYVSDHPLKGAETTLRKLVDASVSEARELEDGAVRVVGGVVTALARKWTKRGDLMATFVLEDLDGAMEVMVFPRTMQEWGSLLTDDAIVCVKARVDKREDEPKLTCLEIRRPEINFETSTELHLRLPDGITDAIVTDLKQLLSEYGGKSDVVLHFGGTKVRLPADLRVDPSSRLVAELRVLLGPTAVI